MKPPPRPHARLLALFITIQVFQVALPQFEDPTRERRIINSGDPSLTCRHTINLAEVRFPVFIESPNHPYPYWPNLACKWVLVAPFGSRIRLFFNHFTLQPPDAIGRCFADYLEIRDLATTLKFCGMAGPPGDVFISSGPSLELVFVSDFSWEYPGFSLRVGLENIKCGGIATDPKPGVFSSPNYPKDYPSNTLCAWKFRVSTGSLIRLDCSENFQLESAENCRTDFLAISLSGIDSMKDARRFCGDTPPGTFISTGRELNVLFQTNSFYNFQGFSCKYEVINNPHKEITGSGDTLANSEIKAICDCGKSDIRRRRVIGGTSTASLPWLAAITLPTAQLVCGGVLVAPRFVLTAGHCFKGITKDKIRVILDNYDPRLGVENSMILVKDLILHPNYNGFNYDMALLELDLPSREMHYHVPACLPPQDFELTPGLEAEVYGWGRTLKAFYDGLQKVSVPIQDDVTCRNAFANLTNITSNMFCAGVEGKDACEGDSGSPLLLRQDNRVVIIGLVSFGYGCGKPGYPGVYVKIPLFVNWIKQKAGIPDHC